MSGGDLRRDGTVPLPPVAPDRTRVVVRLESPVATSFRARRAADSLDIDAAAKSVHELTVDLDLETPYHLGVIVGASGSGKTTLARQIFGDACMRDVLDLAQPVIDQFPDAWSYDDCAAALAGVGLTAVPCWIRPAHTLSNGQRARAEAALQMARATQDPRGGAIVIDEWTSVVDRTVAKVMSHCIQKHARRTGARIVLLSCHYDVLDWLNADWIIDCNRAEYIDRRSVQPGFRRDEQLRFDIHECDVQTWRFFEKYHYLSSRLPGGIVYTYGLYHGANQIGFQCFANYVPWSKEQQKAGAPIVLHSNRTVIHPDYAGLGLGIRLITAASIDMLHRRRCRVLAKFSSTPVYRAMRKAPEWVFTGAQRKIGRTSKGGIGRTQSFRENVTTYHFECRPEIAAPRETPPADIAHLCPSPEQ